MNVKKSASNIKKNIIRYLDLALPVKKVMTPTMANEFEKFQNGNGDYEGKGLDFIKEPYLELATVYKEANETLADLIESKDLEKEVAEAFAKYILDDSGASPEKVKLYVHQLQSLRSVRNKKNFVVCTGTGSGKTECFLLPIINDIYKQHKNRKDEYDEHVRALILYPMNALVNDQVRRLRKLLQYLPGITFGRYTSETDKKQSRIDGGEDGFAKVWNEGAKYIGDTNENGLRDEFYLPEEYTDRQRWQRGGADILVTNYAMLERLLLLPNQKLFDKAWDFIVLDEAHSYSGASGTEIAWLIRRLTNRINPKGKHDIRFLATSATLSTAEDKETRDRLTKEFASSLFPARVETFDVHSGEIEPPALLPNNNHDINLCGKDNQIDGLYEETVTFEAKKTNHKIAGKRIKLLEHILANKGKVRLAQLVELDANFFEKHPKVVDGDNIIEGNEVQVSEGVRWLCKLMFVFSRNYVQYRHVLHDELDGHRSEWDNDANRVGNRLSLLRVWENLEENVQNHPQTIHWETICYLYRSIEVLLQPEIRVENSDEDIWKGSAQNLEVVLCDAVLKKFENSIKEYKEVGQKLAESEKEIFEKWNNFFLDTTGDNYKELIYNAIASRSDVAQFLNAASSPDSVSNIASLANLDLADMEKLMNIGALACQKGKRRPFIDVRFHQVVRDIANVGVYFKDGNPECPIFVQSEDEFTEDGEKIFGLGVCRRCGQPYLLGYGNESHADGNMAFVMSLSRFPYGESTRLHAFSLTAPEDLDEDADGQVNHVFVDLKSGELSCTVNNANDKVKVYWLLTHKEDKESYISKCCACGGNANADAVYGIVTPYEAIGIQFKIKMLEAFAREANVDPDENIRQNTHAGGRKILSFADSRSGASSLAFSFDRTIQATYCDELVMRLRDGFVEEAERQPNELNAIQRLRDRGYSEEIIQDLYPPLPSRIPLVETLIKKPNGQNYFKEIVSNDHYERLIELEEVNEHGGANGALIDECNVSKLRVLKALIAGNRRVGLLPLKRLKILSKHIKDLTLQNIAYRRLFGTPFHEISDEKMKLILQDIYTHLVCSKLITFGNENKSLENEFYPKWKPKDNFKKATIDNNNPPAHHAVTKIICKHLTTLGFGDIDGIKDNVTTLRKNIWTLFLDLGIISPIGNGNDPTYQFKFDVLCKDLIVEKGESFPENIANSSDEDRILPFVIQEHTAQIDSRIGAFYQRAFSEGQINILSCSTTFEMGVDVGSLNNVFLGNMPPSSASYRQRAGRAGRRPGSAPWVLTLCSSTSSYDRDRYESPKKLFFGEIAPPHLYLDRPQFAARHFRAEALHDFLQWIYENKRKSQDGNEKDSAKKWNKISNFLLGRKTIRVQGANPSQFKAQKIQITCCDWLEDWKREKEETINKYVSGIYRYGEDFIKNLPDAQYSAVDDVIFQLKHIYNFCGKNGEEGVSYFRSLGGCNIPELHNDSLSPNSRQKWRSLKQRLEWKFRLLADNNYDNRGLISDDFINGQWNDDTILSLSQAKLLWESTIDVLSDACVLPRYGFPVDTIKLVTARDDENAYGIDLQRPIHHGMYEYAPGQSVYANKRRYKSKGAKVYRFNNGDANAVVGAQGASLKYCNNCNKVFFHGEETCPCCQNNTVDKEFVTPELFIAEKGSINPSNQHTPRGRRIVSWSGSLSMRTSRVVKGMSLLTAEPTERAVHYVNNCITNRDWYYLCEVPTNVALWVPGFWNSVFDNWTPERALNAFTSAMYALRKAMAVVLNINERDVGCVVQAYRPRHNNNSNFWFVFFDADNGGGSGCVLDLLLRGDNDEGEIKRIKSIVTNAIELLEGCTCGNQYNPCLVPVPPSEYRDEEQTRPSSSCYHCLRTYDNQYEHDKLDRHDAIKVLKILLDGENHPPAEVLGTLSNGNDVEINEAQAANLVQREWVWISFTGRVRVNQWYRKRNGEEFQYRLGMNVDKSDIEFERN